MEFKSVLTLLLDRFLKHNVRYGLMGGFALGLWGVVRATADLDFLVHRDDLPKIDDSMKAMGYECKFRSDNVSQFVSSRSIYGEIDFIHAFRQASVEMIRRAVEMKIFNSELNIRVLIPEDIIGLKLQAIKNDPRRRQQDMEDIKALVVVRQGKLDWKLINEYVTILDAADLLTELKGDEP
jgi:hypothetical protein